MLDRDGDTLVLYSDWERTPRCASVPHIARDHLGEGVLFETRHEGRHYTWRLIHPGTGDVGAFFDAIRAAVGDCATTELLKTGRTSATDAGGSRGSRGSGGSDGDEVTLSPEQEAALRAAVEHGYYETPRETDVSGLADHLGVPRSTLTYRLRRAEDHLAKRHVADGQLPDAPAGG